MDPVTLTAISVGATAIGTGVSAFGASQQGKAQAGQFQYQAGIARINQQVAKQNADYVRATGEVEAQQVGMKTRSEMGKATAIQGASGLDVGSGSAVGVRKGISDIGAENTGIVRANAAKRAYGFEVEGLQAGAQAGVYDVGAKNARKAGMLGVASSLISGAASVSSKWLQASQVGIGSGPGGGFYGGSPDDNPLLRPY